MRTSTWLPPNISPISIMKLHLNGNNNCCCYLVEQMSCCLLTWALLMLLTAVLIMFYSVAYFLVATVSAVFITMLITRNTHAPPVTRGRSFGNFISKAVCSYCLFGFYYSSLTVMYICVCGSFIYQTATKVVVTRYCNEICRVLKHKRLN